MIYCLSWLPVAGILVRMVKPWPNLFFKWELEPKHCSLISRLHIVTCIKITTMMITMTTTWNCPLTMMASRSQSASHSSMLWLVNTTDCPFRWIRPDQDQDRDHQCIYRAWELIKIRITKVHKMVKSWTKIRTMIPRDDQQIHKNQEKVSSMWSRPTYNGPQVPSRHRIHSCTWLVEEDKRWFANLKFFLRTPHWGQ